MASKKVETDGEQPDESDRTNGGGASKRASEVALEAEQSSGGAASAKRVPKTSQRRNLSQKRVTKKPTRPPDTRTEKKSRLDRAVLWAGLLVSVSTLLYSLLALRPQLDKLDIDRAQAELQLEASAPTFSVEYLELKGDLLLEIATGAQEDKKVDLVGQLPDIDRTRVLRNEVWTTAEDMLREGLELSNSGLCAKREPHPQLVLSPTDPDFADRSLSSSPCAGGIESVFFLRLKATGDVPVRSAVVSGELIDFEGFATPALLPVTCYEDLQEPFQDSDIDDADAEGYSTTRVDQQIKTMEPGDVVLIPLDIRTIDGLRVAPKYTFDSVDILGVNGDVKSSIPLRGIVPERQVPLAQITDEQQGGGC